MHSHIVMEHSLGVLKPFIMRGFPSSPYLSIICGDGPSAGSRLSCSEVRSRVESVWTASDSKAKSVSKAAGGMSRILSQQKQSIRRIRGMMRKDDNM